MESGVSENAVSGHIQFLLPGETACFAVSSFFSIHLTIVFFIPHAGGYGVALNVHPYACPHTGNT